MNEKYIKLVLSVLLAFNLTASSLAGQEDRVSLQGIEKQSPTRFNLVDNDTAADIYVCEDDWKVSRIAARDLALDVERVTSHLPTVKHTTTDLSAHTVLVGTIGKSPVIDDLIKTGRLNVDDIKGKWESFVIATIADPLLGVERGLVIAGSDRRGTAYGVYELSRRIGVSPWYWWADVQPKRRGALYIEIDRLQVGPPAVKYRGIFINDEMWGILPWARDNFAPDEGNGIGPKTHAKIFELLLRLRANYIWPAMHRKTIPFNYYPQNKVVADDYTIVMGTSHIEPMLRNNMHEAEWDQEDGGPWNYVTNRDAIYRYWEKRIKTNGRYENIYTIGMRGKDDEAMEGGSTKAEKIALLERIFDDQREILTKHVNPDPTKVPQVFIPYTEVLGLYDAGMQVPADAIICWPDDNFGYIRRLPTEAEQKRTGGSGVYYHIQWLNGATTAYTWLNTTPLAQIYAEMNKAWQYNARSMWVLNVGDIKPGEVGTEFFLDMAWDPTRWRHDNIRTYLQQWAARDLDARYAKEIASIMEEHFRLGFTRRPEHLLQERKGKLSYSWFSHEHYNDEAQQRLDRYADIAQRAQAVYDQLPRERKDAFFQLVLYPVQCANLINQKIIYADKNKYHAERKHACAAEYSQRARDAAARIDELTDHYNTGLLTVGDKWNHMISSAPGPWGNQRHQFEMPPLSDFAGSGKQSLVVSAEGGRKDVVSGLSIYTQGKRFIDLLNTGKGSIEWKATTFKPWINLSKTQGEFTTQQRLWVSVNWDRAPQGEDLQAILDISSAAGKHKITVPIFNPEKPARDALEGFVESHGYISMEAEHFTHRQARNAACWKTIKGLGRSGDSVTIFPTTLPSHTESSAIRQLSPSLSYDMHLFSTGDHKLHIDCLPTQPVSPDRGVRLAISIDDGKLQLIGDQPRQYPADVLTNLRRYTTTVKINKPGLHTLTLWMVDPGVIVDKIVLYTREPKDSYLGPPESYSAELKPAISSD